MSADFHQSRALISQCCAALGLTPPLAELSQLALAVTPENLAEVMSRFQLAASLQKLPPADMAVPALVFIEDEPWLVRRRAEDGLALESANGESRSLSHGEWQTLCLGRSWYIQAKELTDLRATEHQKSSPRHYLAEAFDEMRPFLKSFLLASFAANLLALVTPLFTMNVYDRVVPNQATDTLWVLASGVCVAMLFDYLLRQSRARLADVAGKHVDQQVSGKLFGKLLGMKLENRPASAGAFAKQLQEFDSIRDFITSATLVALVDLPFTLLFLALMAWLGGWMVMVPVFAMAFLIGMSLILERRIAAAVEKSGQLSTQKQAHLIETLNLLPELKQAGALGKAQRLWDNSIRELADWQNESRIASNTLSHLVAASQQLVTVGLVVAGVYQIYEGNLSMGALIALVMLSGRAASAINQIAILLLKYRQTRSAMTAIDSIMALPQETDVQSLNATKLGFDGSVMLRNACFSYPEQPMPAFSDINIDIKPGERIGLFGASGAGKSSLLAVLAAQYRPSSGQVFYHGLEASQWSQPYLRRHIGMVSQQPLLSFGTVLDNLLLGLDEVDEQKLARVLVSSGIDKLLDRMGAGLSTQVGEFGRQLSGGQRQAILLGRALLREPKLLLLDEPTSALDERAENQIIASLKALERDVTLVIASHQPRVLAMCDRVFILDKGRIVAEQRPSELGSGKRLKSVSISRREVSE
ncbi:type I secretion system permease/ATPase [Shewanella sp. JM162201]|uniref:Type I secretion system permease/ATPase n=1 Tax=Shewanella jiangmenensis TaxID=2837387 RepID=A0ABS5V7L9_9GAMM|nr:type I secretion system permease/ATPase [Shewanella jiangmenensis]MBT1446429.1 type I secretion system permease/ATPase [Shewanella jiangmenensis]